MKWSSIGTSVVYSNYPFFWTYSLYLIIVTRTTTIQIFWFRKKLKCRKTTIDASNLEYFIDIDKDSITRGNEPTITVNVINEDSKEELSGIEIDRFIKYAIKITVKSFLE